MLALIDGEPVRISIHRIQQIAIGEGGQALQREAQEMALMILTQRMAQ
jgi:hypothetical protein